MRFPHLQDTSFPNLRTVNVYEFQNNFDYTRWSEKTEVTLCNVIWNSDYSDIVKFDTNEIRDAWFDNMQDVYKIKLESAARIVPDSYVKLPIPYDIMARYNYLFIDMPVATSKEAPLDYEQDYGVRRWYFFINKIAYLSPSATQVFVEPDVWQIYQNEIYIKYMLLERGHAPVKASNVEEYLQNPIANSRYLLAPDVSFDNAVINRSVEYLPFGNGIKYVCIASVCTPNQLSSLGEAYVDASYAPFVGPIVYSDVDARYGHQLDVSGFTIGAGKNFSNISTPASAAISNGNRIANNTTIYAVAASDCYGSGTFFSDVMAKCPQFLNTVQACFVVDNALLRFGQSYTIAGHTVKACMGIDETTIYTQQLSKADFSYPTEYANLAKLYTSPYAQIEVTDNDGKTCTINIEETSTLSAKAVTSVAFPYINMRVFLDGIRGSGATSYVWYDLAENAASMSIPKSDWFDYCFDWQIPTFALFMDGSTAYQIGSFNRSVRQGINDAIVSYHTTMRSANTGYENACDTADTGKTNTDAAALQAKTNADRSADTAKTNADASADTTKTNTDASADTARLNAHHTADTAKANSDNSAATSKTNADNDAQCAYDDAITARNTSKANADNLANTAKTNSDNTAATEYDCVDRNAQCQTDNMTLKHSAEATANAYKVTVSNTICGLNNSKASDMANYANGLCLYTQQAEEKKSFGMASNSAISSIVTGGVHGVQSADPLIGAVMGIVAGGVEAAINYQNVGVATQCDQQVRDAQIQYNTSTTSNGNSYANDIQNEINSLGTSTLGNVAIPTEGAQNTNIVTTMRTNATQRKTTTNTNSANDKSTALTNNTNSYNAATTIATNDKTTANTNAVNNKTTANTNAANTQANAKGCADDTNATTKANATRSQTTAKNNATRTQTTTKANALGTYDTTVANSTRTNVNVKANAGYTREVEELNAKELLENAANNGMASILDARNAAPVRICSNGGDPSADYMRTRGLQFKIKTQSDSAIRQAGDVFVRYGYALNQFWDVASSGLKLMKHFTYWKASEIWVDDRYSSNNFVENFIQGMFLRGVTVWNDPTEIGKVNVYDN